MLFGPAVFKGKILVQGQGAAEIIEVGEKNAACNVLGDGVGGPVAGTAAHLRGLLPCPLRKKRDSEALGHC